MFCFQHLFSFSAAIALFAGVSVAQQFVTYDPAIPNRELASNNCPPAPAMLRARDLRTRGVAPMPVSGAVTADNRYGTLYTTTGFAADGIDAVSFAQIGSGTIDANYAAPAGFARITGMLIDPKNSLGRFMFVTDGNMLVKYDFDAGALVDAPIVIPRPAGEIATGLAYDPVTEELVVVTNAATLLRVTILIAGQSQTTFTWTTTAPSVAVPALATGVACNRSQPGVPLVSFYSGVVMSPETGATLAFSTPANTTRHPRGIAFLGAAAPLGGGGVYPFKPTVRQLGSFETGSTTLELQLQSATPTLLAIDLAPTYTAIPGLPIFDGTMMVNLATCVTLVQGPGQHVLPLDLTNVPAGVAFVAQAAGLTPGALPLSDAISVQVWR